MLLKEWGEDRMIIADVTATGDDNVLTAKSSDIAYRKEQLKRLQDEVIELEDCRVGRLRATGFCRGAEPTIMND